MKRLIAIPWRDILFVLGAAAAIWGIGLWSVAAAMVCGGMAICVGTVWVSRQ